jgi:MFS family permease
MVVSESDAPLPLPDVDSPYFSVQVFGKTSSYDIGGFTFRFITLPLIFGIPAFLLFLAVAGWFLAPTLLTWMAAYFAAMYVVLLVYQTLKRPIDFGGAGMNPLAPASVAELIEADHLDWRRVG